MCVRRSLAVCPGYYVCTAMPCLAMLMLEQFINGPSAALLLRCYGTAAQQPSSFP